MRKTILALSVAVIGFPSLASAQAPASPHSFTGNVGLFSEYIFRGLTQTNGKPAVQGGFDYAHSSGFYAGTWASNISWLTDFGAYTSSSIEMDVYGGYKNSFGDFAYDIGLLQYVYPGSVVAGGIKADTTEIYGSLGWKWLSAKLSISTDKDTFGVTNSRGTYYLDLSASYPVTDKFSLLAHYGIQKFKGSTPAGVSNSSFASYKDWKIGASYALPQSFTVGAYYTDTKMDATQRAFYTTPAARFVGDDAVVIYIQKTF